MPPALFFFVKIVLTIWDLLCSIQIVAFFFSSVKDAIEVLIGIVLNLKMAFDSMGILFNINSLNPLT